MRYRDFAHHALENGPGLSFFPATTSTLTVVFSNFPIITDSDFLICVRGRINFAEKVKSKAQNSFFHENQFYYLHLPLKEEKSCRKCSVALYGGSINQKVKPINQKVKSLWRMWRFSVLKKCRLNRGQRDCFFRGRQTLALEAKKKNR